MTPTIRLLLFITGSLHSIDDACTNWAEEIFSRMRRAEIGIHHHIAGADLLRYAQESSWRDDNRRLRTVSESITSPLCLFEAWQVS
jgi:hypothetical protein